MNDALIVFVKKYRIDPNQFQESQTWITILLLSLLVAATLFGVALIFIYYQKLIKLYRFQQNFINGFTHELKTPIASLRLYLDTFKKYDLARGEQLKYINYMIQDTNRLTLNVNQILQIAKLEDKTFKPTLYKVDIYTFIEDFFKKNPHYFEEITIELSKEDELTRGEYIEVEPDLFEMVIMNIVTNAIIYTKNTKPKLVIIFQKSKNMFLIKFIDNGIGIEEHELKKVFHKMYQIGKRIKGSGLGLYLSTNLMRIHNGKLSAESDGEGKGATITVALPVRGGDNV